MPMIRSFVLPRLVASTFILFAVFAGTAHAAANTYCNPPSGTTGSTTFVGGIWGDGDDWTNGQPDAQCDAIIPAGESVTLSTATGPGSYGNFNSGSAAGLTINQGATVIVEGVASDVEGNWSNATTLSIGGDGLTIANGATLDLDATGNTGSGFTAGGGNAPGGSANVNVDGNPGAPAPVTNDGTIVASSSDASFGESLNIYGTLTNAGTISDQSGLLTFQGQQSGPYLVNNTGSFSIASGASFNMLAGDGSSFTNDGTFANQGTATLEQSMYWIQSGGGETGNPVEFTGSETLQDSAGAGSFELTYIPNITDCSNAGLTGTVPAGQTITVNGSCSGTTLNLGTSSDTAPVVNDGTINLEAPAGGGDAIIQGSELENHGTLNSTVGGALPLANQLLVPLVNEPGGTVNLTGGELQQTTGSTTSNAGTVNIGPGATWLVQGGAFTNTGTLAPQIASTSSVGTVNLTVGSKLTAGGTLAPTLTSGYTPAKGTEFPIITMNGGSPTGTFGSVTNGFTADYSKETASPGYLGVIYGGAAVAPAVSKIRAGAGEATFKVSCPASAGSCERYTATATVTEKVKGKKIVAMAASAKKKTATKTKVVTVASHSGSLQPGKSATVTLKLNATGRALLKRFHKLKVRIVVKVGGKIISSATVTITEPTEKK